MDINPGDTLALRSPAGLLESSPIFSGLDRETLLAIGASLQWIAVPGGAILFEAGEPSDALYLVISGCLGAYVGGNLIARIPAGETVGEMSLLSGRAHSASVRAIRDSDVACLPREIFERFVVANPVALLRIARLLVGRLEARELRDQRVVPRTYTLIPHGPDVDLDAFAASFTAELATRGRVELVRAERGADHTSSRFHRIENANHFVVYAGDAAPTAWTKLCLRQADAVLLVARAAAQPSPFQLGDGPEPPRELAARAELVLLHANGGIDTGSGARWRPQLPGAPHHHVRSGDDIARLARLLTGNSVGLVLSGGGARGFAHIGVVRAVREAGIPIDQVGGTSIGAIMGAGVAAGWSTPEMIERFRRTFVSTNPLNDYTLPFVSLVAGHKVSRLLRQEFGDIAIEDLVLPFYAVSANLTTGRSSVHRQGELWRWLRASVAIPGVLPPVFHRGDVHVDGGAINNLPVDVMRATSTGAIVGVDVGTDETFVTDVAEPDTPSMWNLPGWIRHQRRRPGILQILWRAGMINSDAATAVGRLQADLLLHPPLAHIDLLAWKSFDQAIEIGYRHASEQIAALDKASLAKLGLSRSPLPPLPPR